MSIRVAICAKSTQDENWWYSIYQVNICPVVSFYCVKLILCFCVVAMLLMSQRLGQTSHISWDKLSEFIISFINSFDKTKLDGGVADYPEEILVAGGSSALIEFVILVYRFAIKICHGCNFWHSLFSLVLNLSCSVHLSHRSKGAQSSALHITWYHNRVLRIIYEFSPFLFRDGFYPSNAPVELWSRNPHTLSGSTNHNIIFGDFCRHRSKTWAAGQQDDMK